MAGAKRDLEAEKAAACDHCGAQIGSPCGGHQSGSEAGTHRVRREAAYRRNTLVFDHERRQVFRELHEVLSHELKLRRERPGEARSVDALGRPVRVPVWFAAEHDAMCAKVNELRHARGFGPVHGDQIARAEEQARDKSDYAEAFARRCVDLVFWADPSI